jgi:hypothetical protein
MAKLMFVFAVLTRFIPHPWNFSPVFGALLFGGARIRFRDAVWFPVAVLAATDYIFTTVLYARPMNVTHWFVWASYAAMAITGRMLAKRVTARRFAAASLIGTTLFYLISNFGVWVGYATYPPTWPGLLACYIAGLPLYRNSVFATLVFGAGLFAAHEYYRRYRAASAERAAA